MIERNLSAIKRIEKRDRMYFMRRKNRSKACKPEYFCAPALISAPKALFFSMNYKRYYMT